MTPASPERIANPVTEAILQRRAVRGEFTGQPIPDEILTAIVHCGLAAPSSKNAQPWRLHVVTDRDLLEDLARAVETAKGADTYVPVDPLTGVRHASWPSTVVVSAQVLRRASAAVFIENRGPFSRGRRVLMQSIHEGRVKSLVAYSFEIIGIGAAIQNMWIAAEGLGLRACFMGDVVIAEEEISRRLGIETDLMGVIALGYAEAPELRPPDGGVLSDTSRVVWHGRTEGASRAEHDVTRGTGQ